MASISPPVHTRSTITTDDWITPKWLIELLGPFDLDPCSSINQPWPCAKACLTVNDDGLSKNWNGISNNPPFVWMNPPYGRSTNIWLERLSKHGSGIALVFARTDTRMFFEHVWPKASAMLFIRGRLTFHRPDGRASKAGHNSGGPSVLIGYGALAAKRLRWARDIGAFVRLIK